MAAGAAFVALSGGRLPFQISSSGQSCQLATPVFGVLRCVSLGVTETQQLVMTQFSSSEAKGSYSCLSNCQLQSYSDISFDQACTNVVGGKGTKAAQILVDGTVRAQVQDDSSGVSVTAGSFPVSFTRPQQITVRAWCDQRFLISGSIVAATGKTNLQKTAIRLQEEQAGSLPAVNLAGTNDCNWNSQLTDTYKELKQQAESYYDTSQQRTVSSGAGSITNLQNAPTNWQVGDNYIFTRAYQPSISLNFFQAPDGTIYWVGGLAGSRQLYSVKQVTSPIDGTCYAIPQSLVKTVECAFPTDCNYKGVGYTCDTSTFTCKTSGTACNSDLECGAVFGTAQCINRVLDGWTCDLSQPTGGKAGTCKNTKQSVNQCPGECTGSQFWDKTTTTCKNIDQLLDCPQGACCIAGGSYKPQSCSFGQVCCPRSGSSDVGDCKQSCGTPPACTADSDCNDFDPSTIDKCEINTLTGNKCTHTPRGPPPWDWAGTLPWLFIVLAIVAAAVVIYKKRRG